MGGIGWRARSGGEHQVVVLPSAPCSLPYIVLARLMVAKRVNAALRQFQGSARFPGLGVTASADRPPDHHERRVAVEVNIGPGERPEFLGPGASEQRQDDVGVQTRVLRGG